MADAVLHKFFDFGERALANLTLASGERLLLTILPAGFAVHRLHLFGILPGVCLFGANPPAYQQMAAVLARDAETSPPLPRARGRHEIDPAVISGTGERPLSLFTRLALTAADAEDLVRRLERARNVVV